MKLSSSYTAASICALVSFCAFCLPASAQNDFLETQTPLSTLQVDAQTPSVFNQSSLYTSDDSSLAQLRGGFDVVSNDANLKGVVADNYASNIVSGNNIVSNGSFSNSVGLPLVVQNSGANVLIQNSTIINLQMK